MKTTQGRPHPLITLTIGLLLGWQCSRLRIDQWCYSPRSSFPVVASSTKSSGWHQVDVFYGESTYLDSYPPRSNQWTAQVDQDRLVWLLLKKKTEGYFIDLASNDATYLSNTYALETLHNWTGLCLEANPKYWHRLASRPRCKVVGAVVGHRTMEPINFTFPPSGMPFTLSDGGLFGGIVRPDFDNKKDHLFEPRYTVALSDVFDRYNVPSTIDYLSLDVEGAESYIMGAFPFRKYRVKLLTVERPKRDLKEQLMKNGYVKITRLSDFGETIHCHQSFLSSLDFEAAGLDKPNRS